MYIDAQNLFSDEQALTGSAAGDKFVLAVPADQSGERYLRLSYTLGGTTPSVTVTAFLIPHNMVHNYVQYADGFTIS